MESEMEPIAFETHEVLNQPPPFEDVNFFDADVVLQEALEREGAGWAAGQAAEVGRAWGSAETLRWGFEWDIAAAALIAEESGATVTGALGQPLAFNTAAGEAFGVLAATPGIHAAAVERLRERAMELV